VRDEEMYIPYQPTIDAGRAVARLPERASTYMSSNEARLGTMHGNAGSIAWRRTWLIYARQWVKLEERGGEEERRKRLARSRECRTADLRFNTVHLM